MITLEQACERALKSGGNICRINTILDIGAAWLITIEDKATCEVPTQPPFCIDKETGKHQPYFAPRDFQRCKNAKNIKITQKFKNDNAN